MASPDNAARVILYLVNPVGGRYRMTTLGLNTDVSGWSPDHRRAMVRASRSSGGLLQEIELSTGRRLSSFVLGNRRLLGYAGAGGHSLLLAYPAVWPAGESGPTGLERVSTSGAHQRYYPGSAPLTGRLNGSILYSADGSVFLISGQRGFAVFSNDGALLQQIRYPASSYCYASHWWSDQVALGTCAYLPTPNGPSSPRNLFLIYLNGARIRQLTRAVSPDYGFTDAWPFSGGVLAQRIASCGHGPLVVLDSNGTEHPYHVTFPAGVSGQPFLVRVFADRATLLTQGVCKPYPQSLVSLNLRTGTVTALLGPGLNGGTVAY